MRVVVRPHDVLGSDKVEILASNNVVGGESVRLADAITGKGVVPLT